MSLLFVVVDVMISFASLFLSRHARPLLPFLLTFGLAACGGGGGGSGGGSQSVAAQAAPAATSTTTTSSSATTSTATPTPVATTTPSDAATSTPSAATPSTTTTAQTCRTLQGANVAGGEFGSAVPGRYGYDYIYPSRTEIDFVKSLDLRLVRIPFLWERLQRAASTALDADELARLDQAVDLATAAGMTVVLDAHNYGYYAGVQLTATNAPPAALPDLWARLATHYKANPKVAFGLMNEPHDIDVAAWSAMVQRTLAAIRATGATNTVIVPGTNWDGASSWESSLGSASNATALLPVGVNDANVVFEVHQYFDTGYSGTADTCAAATSAVSALGAVSRWARANQVKLFLGEFGVSQRAECVAALDQALTVVDDNSDVWYGTAYWAAGAWWGDYMFNIQKTGGTPQGAVLKKHAASCKG